MEKMQELAKLAEPIAEYLRENHNPHCAIVITEDAVRIVSDEAYALLGLDD